MNTDENLDMARLEYDKGYTLYGFKLATDDDHVFGVSKRGSVRIYLKFDVHSRIPSTSSCTQSMIK